MPPKKGRKGPIQKKITPGGKASAVTDVPPRPKRNAPKKRFEGYETGSEEEEAPASRRGEQLP